VKNIFAFIYSAISIGSFSVLAQPSAFEQALEHDNTIETHETMETKGKEKFRRIESTVGVFIFKIDADAVSELLCAFDPKTKGLVTVSTQTQHRSRQFLRALKTTCETHKGQTRFKMDEGSKE
jgi:hypothetical protein